jgi:hypothetical protein
LHRAVPVLPMVLHLIGRRSSDYVRHGATLFAALKIATRKITAARNVTSMRWRTAAWPCSKRHLNGLDTPAGVA